MGGDRSNEAKLGCDKDTIRDEILDHDGVDYGNTIIRRSPAAALKQSLPLFSGSCWVTDRTLGSARQVGEG